MPFQFRKEAIEEDLNSNFPSQGQGNPPLYYSLSEVVVPTYSINNVAEGTSLPENLQTAWDFSTGFNSVTNASTTIINNPGFWKVDLTAGTIDAFVSNDMSIFITDGLSNKKIWQFDFVSFAGNQIEATTEDSFVVFLRSGDSLVAKSPAVYATVNVWYRQIADVNGNLVNPLGFSFA